MGFADLSSRYEERDEFRTSEIVALAIVALLLASALLLS